MGEVYRARDTRLDRTVAIKVLSDEIDSPEARERFAREAKAVSSLSGPNICALFDVGDQNGRAYLVMEYLEGETLADRLSRTRLSTEKILEYSIQIAEALSSAHRQGVIHRDLKPANIMLTKSGAKLLDFGLARMAKNPNWPLEAGEPTKTITVKGPLLGTCQYMAPELFEGRPPDARCDLFAFGAMLYEMITGRRAFEGKTQAITIANILQQEPPAMWSGPVPNSSRVAALEHLVRGCLMKDPDQRRQTAHDILLELRWLSEGDAQAEVHRPRPSSRKTRWWVAACAVLVLLVTAVWMLRRPREEARALAASLLPPDKARFVANSLPAVSPDGRRVVFAASSDGRNQLWVRDLDAFSAWLVQGSEGAYNPFWSPDSSNVAFFADGKLKKVKLTGEPPVVLCDVMQGRGGSWNSNDTILFAPYTEGGLYRISSRGGAPAAVTVTDPSAGEVSHRWPWFLPDGKRFLYTSRNSDTSKTAIYVADLESKKKQRLLAAGSNAIFAPPGYLLYVRDRTLMAEPFDADRAQIGGEPFPVAQPVDLITANVQGSFSASATGTLAYYSGGAALNSQLTWFDRSGKNVGTIGEPGSFVQPSLSPDGSALAVDRLNSALGSYDVWEYHLVRGTASRLTFDPRQDGYPLWSPDGRTIVFGSNRAGHWDLYQKSVGDGGKDEAVFESPFDKFPSDWSRDGRYLIYYQIDPKTKYDIWVLPVSEKKEPFRYLATEFNEHRAKLSPNGRWLAYTSDETSRDEIYVQSFPTPGGKARVSVNGGTRPVWSRDGKELYYVALDRKLMAAAVKTEPKFEVEAPRALFDTRMSSTRFFDVSADGRRFLIVDPLPEEAMPPMTLLVNWTAARRRS